METSSARHRRRGSRVTRVGVFAGVVVALAAGFAGNLVGAGAQTQGGGFPVADGLLQSRSGNTLSLSGANGTSKVIVTTKTGYQETKATEATAVKVGSCVRVNGSGDTSTGIAAATVAVLDAASCKQSAARVPGNGNRAGNGEFPGYGRQFPGGGEFPGGGAPNGDFPGGQAPTGGAGGFPGGAGGNGGGITGKVTAVAGTSVKVKGRVVSFPSRNAESGSNNGANAAPTVKNKTVAVTLDAATAYTETVAASADALTTGVCVNARGTTDSVGTVTATSVTVSQPVNGACTGRTGFGPGSGSGGSAGSSGGTTA
jgi:hypothetical protein